MHDLINIFFLHLNYSYNEIRFFYHSYLDPDVRDMEYRQLTYIIKTIMSYLMLKRFLWTIAWQQVLWPEISKIDRLMASSDIFFQYVTWQQIYCLISLLWLN